MPAPFIVVFDANVLIPLSLASGRSHSTRLLSRLRAAGHVVALSPQIRAEVAEKLRTKKSVRDWMRLSDAEIEQFVADLPAILGIEPLKGNVETLGVVKADPTDDKIIAVAVVSTWKNLQEFETGKVVKGAYAER